jgi:hypothetical protein
MFYITPTKTYRESGFSEENYGVGTRVMLRQGCNTSVDSCNDGNKVWEITIGKEHVGAKTIGEIHYAVAGECPYYAKYQLLHELPVPDITIYTKTLAYDEDFSASIRYNHPELFTLLGSNLIITVETDYDTYNYRNFTAGNNYTVSLNLPRDVFKAAGRNDKYTNLKVSAYNVLAPSSTRVYTINNQEVTLSCRPPEVREILLQHACPGSNEGYAALAFDTSQVNEQLKVRWTGTIVGDIPAAKPTTNNMYDNWTNLPVLSLENKAFKEGSYVWWVSLLNHTCESTITGTISVLPDITLSVNSSTDVSCYGGNDGVYSFTVSGSTKDSIEVSYHNDNSDSPKTSRQVGSKKYNVTGLSANPRYPITARYVTRIHELANCGNVTANVIINEPDTIILSTVGTPASPTCEGAPNGSITVATKGGSRQLSYRLYRNGVRDVSRDRTTTKTNFANRKGVDEIITFSGLTVGSYYVEVSDQCGSDKKRTGSITLNLDSLRIINFTNEKDALRCYGDSDGAVNFRASGGSGSYQWRLADKSTTTTNNSLQVQGNFSNLRVGNYRLVLKNDNCCPDSVVQPFSITQPDKLQATPTITHVGCHGGETGSIALSVSGGVGEYKYS